MAHIAFVVGSAGWPRQRNRSGIDGEVCKSAIFSTALASGPGRTTIAENGHDKPDVAVRGYLTVTSITLSVHVDNKDERAGKADTDDFSPETPRARSVILRANSVIRRVISMLIRLLGAGASMVIAGHTGHPVPRGWSALQWTRSITA